MFLKLAVSCWSFRQNYFLAVYTKGRAGAADDCYTQCPYQTGIFCHCQHLELEVKLMTWSSASPKGMQVLMSSTSWMQLVVWLLSPQRCELLPLWMSWVELEVWVTTWLLHCPRTRRYSYLLPPGHSWRCGSQHGPLHPHGAGSCSHCWNCGQSGWEVWVTTWSSASHRAQRCLHLFRVIHQFLRCDKLWANSVQLEETPALFSSSDLLPQM